MKKEHVYRRILTWLKGLTPLLGLSENVTLLPWKQEIYYNLKTGDIISSSPEVPQTEDVLLKRLSEGCLCMGIKHKDEIAAYMWCNLRECDSPLIRFDLRSEEAYLMNARTFSSYRGKNLAPYLRIQLYRHVRQMGRTKFISITSYFNTPAQRFKKKLNAKPQKFYIWIKVFMKYERIILLKSY